MHATLIRFAPHAAIALLAVVLVVWLYAHAYGAGKIAERAKWDAANIEAATRFQEALAAQAVTIEKLDADLRRARREVQARREALSNAVADNPDWSHAPVPDGVRAALERHRAMPADP